MTDCMTLKAQFVERYFKNHEISHRNWARRRGHTLDRVVVQIPARSGSTRLKDKNILELGGHPLLAHAIMVASKLRHVHKVVVNTDSANYAAIAESYGAEVPFLRPADLAKEKSPLSWATYYLIRHFVDAEYPIHAVITLMPTSPFRNISQMQQMVDSLLKYGAAYSAFRANAFSNAYSDSSGGTIQLVTHDSLADSCCCKTLGNFSGNFLIKDYVKCAFHFISNPVELIDIDTELDLELARDVMENGLYDFGYDHARFHSC